MKGAKATSVEVQKWFVLASPDPGDETVWLQLCGVLPTYKFALEHAKALRSGLDLAIERLEGRAGASGKGAE